MQEIKAWLRSGKDFEVGKSLYVKYGTNSFFKSLLNTQGATQYNVKKLGAELKTLAPAPPATPHDAPIPPILPETPPAKMQEVKKVEGPDDQPLPPAPKSPEDFPKYLELKELLKSTYRQLNATWPSWTSTLRNPTSIYAQRIFFPWMIGLKPSGS